MRIFTLTRLAAAFFLFCTLSLAAQAQDQGYWNAAGSAAKSITGDISIGRNRVTIDFSNFTLAPIRVLGPVEVAAAFDADVNGGGHGQLYRLSVPADKQFLHHNTLCGTDSAQWMATYVSGRNLQVAFFSGDTPPVLTVDALANSMTHCGTFEYGR